MPDSSQPHDRRSFLGASALALAAGALPGAGRPARAQAAAQPPAPGAAQRAAGAPPIAVSSANGLRAVEKAVALMRAGADPLDAAVDGVRIIEDDPNDNSVGYGGLPNEEGVVELDASVMHGPTHRAGAVASLRSIKNPAAVAREVARRTDHVLLVGEGALRFARAMGFKEEDLLTPESHKAWLKWKSTLSRDDKWLQPDEFDIPTRFNDKGEPESYLPGAPAAPATPRSFAPQLLDLHHPDPHARRLAMLGVPYTTGTVHVSALSASRDIAGCTSTSGLSWKIPGRVGDSPLIGAGLYTDNDVGSAGATGRGEACIQISGARFIVMRMSIGDTPTEACLAALRMVVDKTRSSRLIGPGRPLFGLTFYALRKDGLYGSATMMSRTRDDPPDSPKSRFAVADAKGARLEDCAFLYELK